MKGIIHIPSKYQTKSELMDVRESKKNKRKEGERNDFMKRKRMKIAHKRERYQSTLHSESIVVK